MAYYTVAHKLQARRRVAAGWTGFRLCVFHLGFPTRVSGVSVFCVVDHGGGSRLRDRRFSHACPGVRVSS